MSKTPVRVLFVEDSPLDVELARALLEQDGFEVQYDRVDTESALRERLARDLPDVVLSDFSMPGFDGAAALEIVCELAPHVPFIFVSGAIGEERAIEALHHGAADYVLKGNLQRLAPSVRRALEHARERVAYEERIEHFANYDRLTGLPNRRLFEDRGTQGIAHSRRSGRSCAVFIVEVDRLSLINRTYDYRASDELLRLVASRLQECVRDGDTLARLGDDAFAILATDLGREADVLIVAVRIRNRMQASFGVPGGDIRLTVSTGISTFPNDGDTFQVLLRNAAIATHRAREQGGNQHQFYLPEMNESAQKALRLQAEVVRAVEAREFELYYQPKVDIATGFICGLEALLRWQHPRRGVVGPDEFIPVLEDTGLIVVVGEWVVTAVCRQITAWQAQGLTVLPVAINLSARQFQDADVDSFVKTALELSGIDPALIEFELTESMVMGDAVEAARVMHNLKSCGVRLAIDDFGVGYSSLAYLTRFPLDSLKIDRAFIREVPESREDAIIAEAIIRLAHALRVKVVAEGVENEAQLSFLALHGCDQIQGYYFSPPLPEPRITEMLRQNPSLRDRARREP